VRYKSDQETRLTLLTTTAELDDCTALLSSTGKLELATELTGADDDGEGDTEAVEDAAVSSDAMEERVSLELPGPARWRRSRLERR
jgi:hypothetical protein